MRKFAWLSCKVLDVAAQAMIRRVEQQERAEQLEDVTAQLMLLSALRKVGIPACQVDARGKC